MTNPNERRSSGRRDEESKDRRIIPRFTDGEILQSVRETLLWSKVLFYFSLFASVFEIAFGFYKGKEAATLGFFWSTTFIILALIVKRYMKMVKYYEENHSVKNLRRIFDSIGLIFTYVTFTFVLFFIVSIFVRTS